MLADFKAGTDTHKVVASRIFDKGWMKSVKKNAKSERQSYMRPTISRESIILQDVFTETLNRIRLEKLVPLKWLTSRHTGNKAVGKKT